MSRITNMDEWDDEGGVLRMGRWMRNTEATIRSKRGQKVLRELETALVALPKPELTDRMFWREPSALERDIAEAWSADASPQVCVLGALARHRGVEYQKAEWLNEETVTEVARWCEDEMGMAYTLAWNLMYENDEGYISQSPQSRYRSMLHWVQARIKPEPTP